MDCSGLFRIVDTRGRLLGLTLLGISLARPCVEDVSAQPVAIGPEQVSRLRQLTDFDSDWSGSDRYDLDNPVALTVTIEGLLLPEEGEAELLFSADGQGGGDFLPPLAPGQVYHATLQLASESRRLGIKTQHFKAGWQARVRGWPATPLNRSPGVLLVDELEVHRGQRFVLHDYQRMRDRRQKQQKAKDAFNGD